MIKLSHFEDNFKIRHPLCVVMVSQALEGHFVILLLVVVLTIVDKKIAYERERERRNLVGNLK